MPPVRWKLTAVAVLYLIHIAAATRTPKDLIDDGWKPIIGHTSGPSFDLGVVNYHKIKKNDDTNTSLRDSISVDIKKSQAITSPKPVSSKSLQQHGHSHLNKVPPSGKQTTYLTGHGYSNNQQPLSILTHRSQTKKHKVPVMGKNHMPIGANGKRTVKPIRGAYSQKDEILAQAHSTGLGNYAFFSPAFGSVKPRPPQQANVDYYNQFASQSNDLYRFQRLPVQQYVLPKNQVQNEVHYTFQAQNDEYTRNLVPPPPSQRYNIEKEKIKEKPTLFKEAEQTKPTTERIQTIKQRPENQILPDTVLYQIPPQYQQATYYVPTQKELGFDVQVTKENIREFHNNIPYQQENTQNIYNSDFTYYKTGKKPTETPSVPTYEVTEEKEWQEPPSTFDHQFQPVENINKNARPLVKQQIEPFLPTPSKPSGAIPTSPTQSEISTIFTELSHKINRQKENLDPNFFTVKEVSTHYPILSNTNVGQFNLQYSIPVQDTADFPNEITTTITPKNRYKIKDIEIVSEIQTVAPISTTTMRDLPQRRRPGHRRRRPTNRNRFTTEEPITTTDYYDLQKEIPQTTMKQRRRRPTQAQRTTEASVFVETNTQRIRHRLRTKPTTASDEEEVPQNHKITFSEEISKPIRGSYVYKSNDSVRRRPTKYYTSTTSEDVMDEEDYPPSSKYTTTEKEIRQHTYYPQENSSEIGYQEEVDEESSEEMFDNYKKETSSNQAIEDATTIMPTSFEYTTKPTTAEIQRGRITIKEIYTTGSEIPDDVTTLATTTASTTPTSTTTQEPTTTTKINRFRRPIHYKPPRPKFSVKDYHQRLNQYISSTEASKVNTESTRTRIHYRTRRPTLKQEEHGEERTEGTRKKFIPKSQRQPITPENNEESTEPSVKTVNSRLRPFGRHRSTTTESTTTQKVSIKPHIFSTLRRPPPLSLKERIYNKNRFNSNEKITASSTEEEKQNDIVATETVQIPTSTEIPTTTKLSTTSTSTTTTEPNLDEVENGETEKDEVEKDELEKDEAEKDEVERDEVDEDEIQEVGSIDIIKNDPLLQSQRVSDLTSSTQNQYNTPGMFKNVSPNVRRIPNYFTLATDDPILPIEAFFPNISKDKQS